MEKFTACFMGHRDTEITMELQLKPQNEIEYLINQKGVKIFLFGSKSKFNDFCYEKVTALKEKYPHIKRIYVRAQYPYISEEYKNYLLESYEDTYYPESVIASGKYRYIKRNYEMINKSEFCVFYYDKKAMGNNGTRVAFNYAKDKNRCIINIFD